MHIILVMFSSPVCALSARHCTGPALIIFFPLPDFDFLTTNMFPLNSDWIALDRCVMCQRRKATLLLYCKTSDITRENYIARGRSKGGKWTHIWWWPHSTPPSRAGEFDALIGGCWYRGLVPYHEQMLHIFFRASNNTFAWYLVNHELHLANQLCRFSYRNPLHYDWV